MSEDNTEATFATPFMERYPWGAIGFAPYPDWLEDVRTCGSFADRNSPTCAPAGNRLLKAICSHHGTLRDPSLDVESWVNEGPPVPIKKTWPDSFMRIWNMWLIR